jgi:hypothetical protein
MASICELLINVVRNTKPNLLRGLNQKVWRGYPDTDSGYADKEATGEETAPNPFVSAEWSTVSPSPCPFGQANCKRGYWGCG